MDERGLEMSKILGKSFQWSRDKNKQLQMERKISFEVVIFSIEEGNLIDTIQHPNQEKYPHQEMLYVKMPDGIYMVPCISETS